MGDVKKFWNNIESFYMNHRKTYWITLALVWTFLGFAYLRNRRTKPGGDYMLFPNQGTVSLDPTKIDVYHEKMRLYLTRVEEPKESGRYCKVGRLTDSRLSVEIPRYPLTLRVDGSYYDYDGQENQSIESKLRKLIPLGLNQSDDYLNISVWDNNGIKSAKIKEVDPTNLQPIREVPQFSDYAETEEFNRHFQRLKDYRELVAQRESTPGCIVSGFSLAGRSTPKRRDFIFRYDKQGIGDASLLKVSVIDEKGNPAEMYLDLKKI